MVDIINTRAYQPSGVGLLQPIHDTKYATRALAAGVIPAVTNFFGAAPSADPTADRYEQGNTLVSSGKNFVIYQILAELQAGAGAVLTDFEKVINTCSVRIITAQKEFGCWPIFMLPQGGGIAIQSGQVAVTPAASPGALSTIGAVNGMPTRQAVFALASALRIQANQSFQMELLGPIAGSPFGAQTLTGIVNVKLILDGIEERPAA